MKRGSILLFMLLLWNVTLAQIGGLRSFEWLEMPYHARSASLGTVNLTSSQEDVNLIWDNASILMDSIAGDFSVSINPYIAGVLNSQISYVHNFQKIGMLGFGLQYLDFGPFEGFDATGSATEAFSAANFAFLITNKRNFGAFGYAVSAKYAQSFIEASSQSAVLFDLSSTFIHPEHNFNIALVLKNLGFYVERGIGEERSLPFDLQIGTSFKPQFMPFRFSFTLNRLYQYDLSNEIEVSNANQNFFNNDVNEISTFDKLFQHVIIGTEVLLGKNIALRAGYSHLIRQSLQSEVFAGAGGFTFGAAFNTKKIKLAYSTAVYQTGGNGHFITLGTNLKQISKKIL